MYSCKTDGDKPFADKDFNQVSESVYPFLFTEGSFWVFSISNSSELDSVYVVSGAWDTWRPGGPSGPGQGSSDSPSYHYYNMDYSSSVRGSYTEYVISDLITSDYLYIQGKTWLIASKEIGSGGNSSTISAVHDQYEVQAGSFNDVTEMHVFEEDMVTLEEIRFYADFVGLIKKIEVSNGDSTTYELLRFEAELFTD